MRQSGFATHRPANPRPNPAAHHMSPSRGILAIAPCELPAGVASGRHPRTAAEHTLPRVACNRAIGGDPPKLDTPVGACVAIRKSMFCSVCG